MTTTRATQSAKVSVNRLTKAFELDNGESLTALKNVSFELSRGEFLCVLGRSGCGKTTLLRLLSGLEAPSTGDIQIQSDRTRTQTSAVVFQEHHLFPWRTVLANVTFGLESQGLPKPEREAKAMAYLKLVVLEDFSRRYPKALSIGMKQRVGIARALAVEPEVLLMDEPTASLDAQTKLQFQKDLLRIWRETGQTIIYITHDVEEAIYLADQLLVLTPQPGRVKAQMDIQLPRPRDRSGVAFNALKSQLYGLLGTEI